MAKSPLLRALSLYLQQGYLGFHTPGHQQGCGSEENLCRWGQGDFLRLDLTELPGLDNLKEPQGCLRESQQLAAQLFGAQQTFYLVNGSTVGLQAALLALNSPGGKVVLPHHAHLAILNGLILSGGSPLPVPVEWDRTWGIPLGVSAPQLAAVLEKENKVDLVLTGQPTYQGTGYTAGDLQRVVREKGCPHVVDEAHGAHLFFQAQAALPLSLQKEGADVVIQSTHKTLTAFTQASMLHVNNSTLVHPLKTALGVLQTTSPSYLLLASLDSVQYQMKLEGISLATRVRELAHLLRREVRKISGYRLFPEEKLAAGWYHDPTKVLISASPLGLTGWALADLLRTKKGIVVEMADSFSVLFLITPGHTGPDIKRVVRALREIKEEERQKPLPHCLYPSGIFENKPYLVLTPREVYYKRKELKKINETVGRICGAPLTVFPPGIPYLWPGEVIKQEHLEYGQWLQQHHSAVLGAAKNGAIAVVAE